MCEARGRVRDCEGQRGRIPWPVGQRDAQSLVLYRDLVKAVSERATWVCQYWWGVGPSAVQKWRRALGVGLGTMVLAVLRRRAVAQGLQKACFVPAQAR